MSNFKKDALLRTLIDDYGINNSAELAVAIKKMNVLDITQFVLPPTQKGEKSCKARATTEDIVTRKKSVRNNSVVFA